MTLTTISLEIKNNIAYVTLNRPNKHNAINLVMFKEISKVLKIINKNNKIRVVILSGNGEDFCSGLDIKSVLKSSSSALSLLFKLFPWRSNLAQRVSTGWRKLNVPVIAAIHGRCWGGGLQIALGADMRLATAKSSLSIMEGKWGLIPDMGGTLALKELVNPDIAMELAITAKTIDGDTALQYGLVTHVVEEPLVEATALANTIILQSPDAVSAIKKLYRKSWWSNAGMALARESFYQIKILLGKNYKVKVHNQTHETSKQKPFV